MRDRSAPLTAADIDSLAWDKMGGLIPAIVQDRVSGDVLMLGWMSREALARTFETGKATFFSRSRQALWEKGETSGNHLSLVSVHRDCDDDTLLVLADPQGPTCHLGTRSCFVGTEMDGPAWLTRLQQVVDERAASGDETSYTRRLLNAGTKRIAQKVGEEGVEVALAATADGPADELAGEIADLLYHLTVLMKDRALDWEQVIAVLKARHAR